MSTPSTDELQNQLNSARSEAALGQYLKDTCRMDLVTEFHVYLNQCMAEKGVPINTLIQKTNISRTYMYEILNGKKHPERNKVLSLCLALSLPLDETNRALKLAGAGTLYPKIKRDSILIYCINKGMSVIDTNHCLVEFKESPLY